MSAPSARARALGGTALSSNAPDETWYVRGSDDQPALMVPDMEGSPYVFYSGPFDRVNHGHSSGHGRRP